MKLNSKYFDSIRVKPEKDRTRKANKPSCDWPGCDKPAEHPAPKGRGRDGEYFRFCLDHVREYNKSYNYFTGMSDAEVAEYQVDSLTGHRPTWSVGVNPNGPRGPEGLGPGPDNGETLRGFRASFSVDDPFGLFGETGQADEAVHDKPRRPVRNMERKCLNALNLDDSASANTIKNRFKDLVKRYHPDLNGGDSSSSDRLREIIQAYNYLKKAGLC